MMYEVCMTSNAESYALHVSQQLSLTCSQCLAQRVCARKAVDSENVISGNTHARAPAHTHTHKLNR